VALIKKRLGVNAVMTPGGKGQFEVRVDGETVAERGGNWFIQGLGAGYPKFGEVVDRIEQRKGMTSEG
jgi:hypothetical protein